MLGAFLGAISQGVLWGIMVLGVYITFKLLDIPDMTVDGSFTLGGFICAILISDGKINPILVLICAILGGLIAGAVTGILHTIFEIPAILAGILTQISLWSINLRIAHKRSNITLPKLGNIFSIVASMTGMKKSQVALVLGIIIVIVIIALLYWFFGTEMGSALRATGNNEAMVRALGINAKTMKLIALMISNGLVALAGALVCQSQGYADINMGTGAIVIGLAAIVIGEVLLGWVKPFYAKLGAAVIGSVVYFIIRAIVLQMGLDSDYMKVLSAVIVAVALSFPVLSKKYRQKKDYHSAGEGGE
jgi:hypothetical protein